LLRYKWKIKLPITKYTTTQNNSTLTKVRNIMCQLSLVKDILSKKGGYWVEIKGINIKCNKQSHIKILNNNKTSLYLVK
jgi:hypothetical protein